jgi:hypothetical protein
MSLNEIIPSSSIQKRAQLGAIPVIVGTIFAQGPQRLFEAYGFSGSITLLSVLIATQVYPIAARIRFDFQGAV